MDAKVIKSSFWYMFSNLLTRLIAFLSAPIFSRMLTKTEYGNFTSFLAWSGIVSILATLNMSSTLGRARYDYEEDVDVYTYSILVLGSFVTLIIYSISAIFQEYIVDLFDMSYTYITVMFLAIIVQPTISAFQALQRFQYKYITIALMAFALALIDLISSLLLVFILEDKELGKILGSQLPTMGIGIGLYIYFAIKAKGRLKTEYWKYALKVSLPYVIHVLALNLLMSMDRVMVKSICGADDAALYNMAYSCALIIMIVFTALNESFVPWLGEKLHCKDYEIIKKYSMWMFVLFFIIASTFMLVVPEVLFIMGGEPYMEAKYTLAPLVMACICQFAYTLIVNIEQYEKKTKGMAIGTLIATISNGILNIILIPQYGYFVAAYTTLISYLLLYFIHLFLLYRMNMQNIYQLKKITGCIFFGLAYTLFVSILYSVYWYIRYIIFIIIGSLFIIWIVRNKSYLQLLHGRES